MTRIFKSYREARSYAETNALCGAKVEPSFDPNGYFIVLSNGDDVKVAR